MGDGLSRVCVSKLIAGQGYNGSFHTAAGEPLANLTRFPGSPKQFCDSLHRMNMSCGWYMNNCLCHETTSSNKAFADPELVDKIYKQSAAALVAWNVDEVKLDSCSMFQVRRISLITTRGPIGPLVSSKAAAG